MGRRKVEIKRIENKAVDKSLSPNDAKVSSKKLDNFQFSVNLPSLLSPSPVPENSTTLPPVTRLFASFKSTEISSFFFCVNRAYALPQT
ncbi:unnamed protein product [Arabidopsis thaliana]|uniref:(thale cress) hypothetical protein n=1 Tax=Arabidopsis thaliana TaxID=3702 RepID=A0A7G2FLT4_ARATH|nr:unnamed protein product [Arabidopsis thaliana]